MKINNKTLFVFLSISLAMSIAAAAGTLTGYRIKGKLYKDKPFIKKVSPKTDLGKRLYAITMRSLAREMAKNN